MLAAVQELVCIKNIVTKDKDVKNTLIICVMVIEFVWTFQNVTIMISYLKTTSRPMSSGWGMAITSWAVTWAQATFPNACKSLNMGNIFQMSAYKCLSAEDEKKFFLLPAEWGIPALPKHSLELKHKPRWCKNM